MNFIDPYLQALSPVRKEKLEEILRDWQMDEAEFVRKLDDWFNNFEHKDKDLAFKVIENVNYYSFRRFDNQLAMLFQYVDQYLCEFDKNLSDVRILIPEERGDSADRHAYDLIKKWGIEQKNIITIDKVQKEIKNNHITSESILVAFNDTYGTGNQFMHSIWKILLGLKEEFEDIPALFVLALAISEKALDYFRYNFDNQKVRVIPDSPQISALDIFTAREYNRLEELCCRVYPSHPMGYGNIGLLTAYYFQCPNNTLPIIWADGSNNIVDGKAYPWNPLFPYRAKRHIKKEICEAAPKKFEERTVLNFSDQELESINSTLARWKCEPVVLEGHMSRMGDWFANFRPEQKALALKLFTHTEFLSIGRVRKLIKDLSYRILEDVRIKGGDRSDILLVLTGHEKSSVYHYVYDFLDLWNLKVSQVVRLEDLEKREYEALNKYLILFYHTRAGKGGHFRDGIWNRLKNMPAKCFYISSFIMSEASRRMFHTLSEKENVKLFYSKEFSRTVKDLFSESECQQMEEIFQEKNFPVKQRVLDSMLTTYYFTCPESAFSFLGYNSPVWKSLFS